MPTDTLPFPVARKPLALGEVLVGQRKVFVVECGEQQSGLCVGAKTHRFAGQLRNEDSRSTANSSSSTAGATRAPSIARCKHWIALSHQPLEFGNCQQATVNRQLSTSESYTAAPSHPAVFPPSRPFMSSSDRPPPTLSVRFYQAVAVGLLLVVALLAFALDRSLDEGKLATTPAPIAAPVVATDGGERGGVAPIAAVSILDLTDLARKLDRVHKERGDSEWFVYRSPTGGVALHSLSYRQLLPLHFHRVANEAIIPVFGEVEVTSHRFEKVPARFDSTPPLGVATSFAPYSGHSLTNLSDSHIALALSFLTVPDDEKSWGNTYAEPGDDRLLLGEAPSQFDPRSDLAALAASRDPFHFHWLPILEGKLASLTVAGKAELEPAVGPTLALVVAGRGTVNEPGGGPIAEGRLLFIPPGMRLHLEAHPDAPLALLVFSPDRDDVSSFVKTGKSLYSHDKEELIIRDYFHDRREGVFLDVGAADYKLASNTYYLEERLGWSGVAVDALNEYAPGYLLHRKRTRFANYLITDKPDGKQRFFRAGNFPEVSSTSKELAQNEAGDGGITELEVESITLNELLGKMGVKKLDFMSLDIEEHEPAALAGFDIERLKPELVCIEAHRPLRDTLYAWFHRHNYQRVDKYLAYDSTNWYFAPRGER